MIVTTRPEGGTAKAVDRDETRPVTPSTSSHAAEVTAPAAGYFSSDKLRDVAVITSDNEQHLCMNAYFTCTNDAAMSVVARGLKSRLFVVLAHQAYQALDRASIEVTDSTDCTRACMSVSVKRPYKANVLIDTRYYDRPGRPPTTEALRSSAGLAFLIFEMHNIVAIRAHRVLDQRAIDRKCCLEEYVWAKEEIEHVVSIATHADVMELADKGFLSEDFPRHSVIYNKTLNYLFQQLRGHTDVVVRAFQVKCPRSRARYQGLWPAPMNEVEKKVIERLLVTRDRIERMNHLQKGDAWVGFVAKIEEAGREASSNLNVNLNFLMQPLSYMEDSLRSRFVQKTTTTTTKSAFRSYR